MAITTLDLKYIEDNSTSVYESVLIMAKRARAITAERKAKEVLQESYLTTEDIAEPEEIEDYEDIPKAVVVAMENYFDGSLEVKYNTVEEEEK
jgi:DNA-directed RNA polymerase subunit K/omega